MPMEEEVGRMGVGDDDIVAGDGDGVVVLLADGCGDCAVVIERSKASWTVSSCAISAMMALSGAAQAL